MAAREIILDMDDRELIWYYQYCMNRVYEALRKKGSAYWHPVFEHSNVIVGKKNIYNLHYPNETFLLNEMWSRFINANFIKQCWWMKMNVFKTKISYDIDLPEYVAKESKPRVKETMDHNGEQFEFVGAGLKRRVFMSPCKTYVIKIPSEPSELGLQENQTEAETYKLKPNSIYAKCELIENGWLKMEYVKPKYFTKDDDYPEWTLSIAEHQVGYNLKGDLVAYDYGSDI